MRRFFISPEKFPSPAESTEEKQLLEIIGQEANHLKNVLRLGPGERVLLFDGTGWEIRAEILKIEGSGVTVQCLSTGYQTGESPIELAVAQGFLKEKKMEELIRPLTELGMSRWMPFFSSRTIPKLDPKKVDARRQRWEKIARESLKQCRRSRIPNMDPPIPFEALLEKAKDYQTRILFWEALPEDDPSADLLDLKEKNPKKGFLILLGPEGGFSAEEAAMAEASGFLRVYLGPRILRAQTAAITAAALIQYIFGDLRQKNLDNEPQKG